MLVKMSFMKTFLAIAKKKVCEAGGLFQNEAFFLDVLIMSKDSFLHYNAFSQWGTEGLLKAVCMCCREDVPFTPTHSFSNLGDKFLQDVNSVSSLLYDFP